MKPKKYLLLPLSLLVLVTTTPINASLLNSKSITQPVLGKDGMVVTQHFLATEIGSEVLLNGGNAFDASIAVAFALAVVLPRAGNIGGGGFMVLYDESSNSFEALDYRERAPEKSYKEMFLNQDGTMNGDISTIGYKSIAVPGTVHGMWAIHKRYGTLSWKSLIDPAINLAREGFRITPMMADTLNENYDKLSKFESTKKIFLSQKPMEFGILLKQPDLANTLEIISIDGVDGFYQGKVAQKITSEMKKNGGLISLKDLKKYRSVWRKPLIGDYKNFKIVTMPPPSSGGIHIIQMLNILNHFSLPDLKHNSPEYSLLLAEIMKYAYADRSKYLADPDFEKVPVEYLISRKYSQEIASRISVGSYTNSDLIAPGIAASHESLDTTHFSIADQYGNLVSNTYTINSTYGSKVVIEGTGILMNNEMDDFSAAPGIPNQFGLLGDESNEIEPFKRPLSSMSPTIIFDMNKPFMVTGSPGGSKIITAVLQNILNVIEFDMEISDAISTPRIHHQWKPDVLSLEYGFDETHAQSISKLGQPIIFEEPGTSLEAIMIRNNIFYGYGDTRRPDSKAIGVNQ